MYLKELLKSKNTQQFIKFLVVGSTAFLVDISINILIVTTLSIEIRKEAAIANVLSYSIALIYNFILSNYWSFKSEDGEQRGVDTMIRFVGVNLFNLAWTSVAVWYVVGIVSSMDILPSENFVQPVSKLLVNALLTVVSFLLYKKFVFSKKQDIPIEEPVYN